MTSAARWKVGALTVLVSAAALRSQPAGASQAQFQAPPTTQSAASSLTAIIKSQHRRLTFTQDIQRIAIGDTEILSAELITSREVLVLGRETGRTTLIVWFVNGSSREYLFAVQRDLSVLERALKLVNPSIEAESAPDRDALVLTGIVPDILVSQTAEVIARNYLDAGNNRRGVAQPLVAAPSAAPDAGGPPAVAPGAGVPNAPSTPQASPSAQ